MTKMDLKKSTKISSAPIWKILASLEDSLSMKGPIYENQHLY
jgi:hypothetical protein